MSGVGVSPYVCWNNEDMWCAACLWPARQPAAQGAPPVTRTLSLPLTAYRERLHPELGTGMLSLAVGVQRHLCSACAVETEYSERVTTRNFSAWL